MPCGLVDVEDAFRGDLRARGIGAIGGGEVEVFELVPGLVGVGQAGFGQGRVAPPLEAVVLVERGLPVADQMQMQNHAPTVQRAVQCNVPYDATNVVRRGARHNAETPRPLREHGVSAVCP